MSGYDHTIIIRTLSRKDCQWIRYAMNHCIYEGIFEHVITWLDTRNAVNSTEDSLDYQKNELGVCRLPEEGLDVIQKSLVGWIHSAPADREGLKYHLDPIIDKIEAHPDYK